MFSLIKLIIWIAGILVIGHFILSYFGYEVNRNYFNESKAKCQEELKECTNEYIRKGTEGADCKIECVDPKLIIKKK